jgi:hypothetical protein
MTPNITRKDAAEYQHDYIHDFIYDELDDRDVITIYNTLHPDNRIYPNTKENLFRAYGTNDVMELLEDMLPGIGKEMRYDANDDYFFVDENSGIAISFEERSAKNDVMENSYYDLYAIEDIVEFAYNHFNEFFDEGQLQELFLRYVHDVDPDLDVNIHDIDNILVNNDILKDDWYDMLMKVYSAVNQ